MNIRLFIQLFSSVWLLIVLLIVNAAIYLLFYHVTMNSELERISQHTEEIVRNIQPGMNEDERAALLRAFLPADGMIRIVNEENHPLITVVKTPELAGMAPEHHSSQWTERKGDAAVSHYPVIWDNGEVASLEVVERLDAALANLNLLKWVLFLATLIVLIPSFFSGRLLSALILRPINSLIDTMEEIQRKGAFKKLEIARRPKDELYKMAIAFNNMIGILEKNFEKQEQFVSDASHELKTPLTVIDSYASMLKRWGKERPELLNESIEAIHSEAARMKAMTEQLLLLAKNEEDWQMDKTAFNLSELCEETSRTFQNAYERQVRVKPLTQSGPLVFADEQKIKQVLFILLDNAKKYSSDAIDVYVGEEGKYGYFIVEDQGIGIPKKDQKQIFDRFYRVDEARNRDHGGTGLGLSIAKKIIDAHDGMIEIESEVQQGTKMKISLPRAAGERQVIGDG